MLGRFIPSNRLILRPLLLILTPPLLFAWLIASPVGVTLLMVFFGFPLFGLWIVIGLFAATKAFHFWQQRDWRQFASWVAVPLAIALGTYNWSYTLMYSSIAGQTLNFAVNLPTYLERIEKLPKGGAPKLEVFNRGGMISASSGVVYDESDEVRLPPGEQSAEWQERAKKSELGCGDFAITPLFGHFYLAGFPC